MVFACGIDGQDIHYPTRKSWGFVIHLEESFYLSFKSIPDEILIPRSQSPPSEYIEGRDFRDTLTENASSKFFRVLSRSF
ncbi:hypothetical protein [Nostoc sp.]|uniref:hypothetical protein n=1 Tax=Nostoc sp. TaxID=1180 RepID=UPI002FF9D6F6